MQTPQRPESGSHAWRVGVLLGTLLKHGINAEAMYVPPSQDYSSMIKITIPETGAFPPMELLVTVINNAEPDDD